MQFRELVDGASEAAPRKAGGKQACTSEDKSYSRGGSC